jgi:hypothetical protein
MPRNERKSQNQGRGGASGNRTGNTARKGNSPNRSGGSTAKGRAQQDVRTSANVGMSLGRSNTGGDQSRK